MNGKLGTPPHPTNNSHIFVIDEQKQALTVFSSMFRKVLSNRSVGSQVFLKSQNGSRHFSSKLVDIGDTQKGLKIKRVTRDWVEKWVFKQKLCPWSGGVLKGSKLSITVFDSKTNWVEDVENDTVEKIVLEASVFAQENESNSIRETALIVLPNMTDFYDFEEMCSMVEETLEKSELDQFVQIASFHPDFEFENTETEVENYTNRSPYPMVHLLRVEQVAAAVKAYAAKRSDKNRTTMEDNDEVSATVSERSEGVVGFKIPIRKEDAVDIAGASILHSTAEELTEQEEEEQFSQEQQAIDAVWERNIQHLRALGLEEVQRIQREIVEGKIDEK